MVSYVFSATDIVHCTELVSRVCTISHVNDMVHGVKIIFTFLCIASIDCKT